MKKQILVAILLMIIISNIAYSQPYNYAKLWNSMNSFSRHIYIKGVVDGISEAYFFTISNVAPDKFAKTPEPLEVKKVREKLFVRYTQDQIPDVITSLYSDPANSYISMIDMFFLARDKIEGKSIEYKLMNARKSAMDSYKLNQNKLK